MQYCLNKVQGFCPVKIEITQFPDGFRLKTIPCSAAHTCCLGQIKESPGHILMCLFYVPSLVPDYCLKCHVTEMH